MIIFPETWFKTASQPQELGPCGKSIPFEAQPLGLRAYRSSLNPIGSINRDIESLVAGGNGASGSWSLSIDDA
jgi:hypothetical protein